MRTYIRLMASLFVMLPCFITGMEPPHDNRPKRHLGADEGRALEKKPRADKTLVMPEIVEVNPHVRRMLEAAAQGDLATLKECYDEFRLGWEVAPLNFDRWLEEYQDDQCRSIYYFALVNEHLQVFDYLLRQALPHNVYYLPDGLVDALRKSSDMSNIFIDNLVPDSTTPLNKKLCVALLLDSEEGIRAAIAEGADVVGNDTEFYRPLHVAVLFGSLHGVRILLAHGCPVDGLNNKGAAALYCAVRNRNEAIVAELINAGANVNLHAENHPTLLHMAVDSDFSDTTIARLFLEHGAAVNSRHGGHDDEGHMSDVTPLHLSALLLDLKHVKLLLGHGADVNARNSVGRMPLHEVCQYFAEDALPVVNTLLEHGAEVNARLSADAGDYAHMTPLSLHLHGANPRFSSEAERIQLLEELLLWGTHVSAADHELLKRIFKSKQFLLAVLFQNQNLQELLLGVHFPVALFNNVLRFALAQQQLQSAQILLSRGAQLHVALDFLNMVLKRPISAQTRATYVAMREALIGPIPSLRNMILYGTSVHEALLRNPDFQQNPPVEDLRPILLSAMLLTAIRSGKKEMVERALAAGADPRSLLFLVMPAGRCPGVGELLAHRALVLALQEGDAVVLKYSLLAGADPNSSYRGMLLLTWAAFFHDAKKAHDMVRVLLERHDVLLPFQLLQQLDELRDRPAVAFFIAEYAKECDVDFTEPDWLIAQKPLLAAFMAGDVDGVQQAFKDGAEPHPSLFFLAMNIHNHNADLANVLVTLLANACTTIPDYVLAQLNEFHAHPRIAARILARAHELPANVEPPQWLIEWNLQNNKKGISGLLS